MKTKITWKTASKILKIDDTTYRHFPAIGEYVEVNGQRYYVAGLDSVAVLLEPAPAGPIEPSLPKVLKERNARVSQRLADEKVVASPKPHAPVTTHKTLPLRKEEPHKVVSHKKK